MNKKFFVLSLILLLSLFLTASSFAGGVFVATAKNLRGALYLGYGPTPCHASEMAMVKCSQDSFIPPSCRVLCVRMECPPPVCASPMAMLPPPRHIRKTRVSKTHRPPYPGPYGRPY
jgi:hypothetical protein